MEGTVNTILVDSNKNKSKLMSPYGTKGISGQDPGYMLGRTCASKTSFLLLARNSRQGSCTSLYLGDDRPGIWEFTWLEKIKDSVQCLT
jgi:hypothetical protein